MEKEFLQSTVTVPAEEGALAEQENLVEMSDVAEDAGRVVADAVNAPGMSPAEANPAEDYVEQSDLAPVDITHRLADEFMVLREEFPELQQPEQLPDVVLDMATEKGISLLDAYLRFRHEERKRVHREVNRRRETSARSAGSLNQGEIISHPQQEAFTRAFRRALK